MGLGLGLVTPFFRERQASNREPSLGVRLELGLGLGLRLGFGLGLGSGLGLGFELGLGLTFHPRP